MIRTIVLGFFLLLVLSANAKKNTRGGQVDGRGRGGDNRKARGGGNDRKARGGGDDRRGRGNNGGTSQRHGRNGNGNNRRHNPKPQGAVAIADEKHYRNPNRQRNRNRRSGMGGGMGGGGMGGMSYGSRSGMYGSGSRSYYDDDYYFDPYDHLCYNVRIKVTNLARGQPFSEFFVMAHNELSIPLFTLGEPASNAFAVLAEDGNGRDLVQFYTNNDRGVYEDSVRIEGGSQPVEFGESIQFRVEVEESFGYISFASMALNTNDAFIGVAGMRVAPGTRMTIFVPGYDAGTEMNNELCEFIPGPACPTDSGNEGTEEGEGVVYISPGIAGVGTDENRTETDLNPALYDWRNPMAKIEVFAEELPTFDDDDDW